MPQQLPYTFYTGSVVEHCRCERVPEHVRRTLPLRGDAREAFLHGIAHLVGVHPRPLCGDEERPVAARDASTSKEELMEENAQLRQQIAELQSQLVDYYDLKKENAQLYKYLDMKELNPDFQLVSASVIGRDPNRFYTFTIDRGTAAGVSVNDPVVTDEGVVGWVSSANSISAEVTTILSPDTRMGGFAETGGTDKVAGESGVISTDIKLADQGLIKLGYLTADTQAKAGDIVVVNGHVGIAAGGGTVIDASSSNGRVVHRSLSSWWRNNFIVAWRIFG